MSSINSIANIIPANNFTITAGNILMHDTTTSTQGVYLLGGTKFLHAYPSVSHNTFVGGNAGNFTMTGVDNSGIGAISLQSLTSGPNNNAQGSGSLSSLTTGDSNTAVGHGAASSLVSGSHNTFIGTGAGGAYTGAESDNIIIGNAVLGTLGESGTIRIGGGAVTKAFVAGIASVNVGSVATVVSIATGTGQLGETTITAGTGIVVTPGAGTITIAANSSTVVETLTGNTGTATPTAGNINVIGNTVEGTARTTGSGSTISLAFTDGNVNVGIGSTVLGSITTAFQSTAVGSGALQHLTSGVSNSAYGVGSLGALTTTDRNSAYGVGSLQSVVTGSYNNAFGYLAGQNYTGAESSNILISNDGVLGESHTIHIGTQGSGNQQQTSCFIAGITGVTVSNAAVVTLNTSTGQLGTTSGVVSSWVEILVVGPTTMSVNTGYIPNNVALVTLTLPSTAAQGSVIRVGGKGTGGWKIAQNAGQTIHYGASDTTLGAGGSLASMLRYDSVELVCITADTDFLVLSSIGNLSVT